MCRKLRKNPPSAVVTLCIYIKSATLVMLQICSVVYVFTIFYTRDFSRLQWFYLCLKHNMFFWLVFWQIRIFNFSELLHIFYLVAATEICAVVQGSLVWTHWLKLQAQNTQSDTVQMSVTCRDNIMTSIYKHWATLSQWVDFSFDCFILKKQIQQ